MSFVLAALLVVGLVWLCAGLRGRRIGDDPHCRGCGFNLRGRDPESARCPECGGDLSRANAIGIGEWRPRPVALVCGLVLVLLGGGALGVSGWQFLRDYDYSPWKPTAWLIDDLDDSRPSARQLASDELMRRLDSPDFPQAKVDALADRLLARQGNRSLAWDPRYGEIFENAAQANRLDAPRLERYLKQAVSATLSLKPRLRRRPNILHVDLALKLDRVSKMGPQVRAAWRLAPLMVGKFEMMRPHFAQVTEEMSLGRGGYNTGIGGAAWNHAKLPDGKHEVRSTLAMTLEMTAPAAAGPVSVDLPVAAPVELFPPDATVDDFSVDEALRPAMQRAFAAALVRRGDDGKVQVRLKPNDLPMALAMAVVLKQGGVEQKVGTLLRDPSDRSRWLQVRGSAAPRFSGVLDIHLRPDQSAADSTKTVGTYWGEEIVVRGVTVDAPYTAPFDHDESQRAAVEQALAGTSIERSPGGALQVTLRAERPPVKLAYRVLLVSGGRAYVVNSYWDAAPDSTVSHRYVCDDITAGGAACDVVFRPSDVWEAHSYDAAPPWGGEVVLRGVKIAAPATRAPAP